ncbi:hypothetical protein SAMN04244560_02448 [Thermoanaerobacter thermohydrosulfuricus]|uniref:Uncharacterized protein n=2 Tax=Thermoanaerobacter thermohydrosulfuricus TaxID=1516 RepID=A0A1G7UPT1_THETY|nr:hypothetical protein SAMN04244560_02448 [Thermoanaerobacter thermohydrosulfuricus]
MSYKQLENIAFKQKVLEFLSKRIEWIIILRKENQEPLDEKEIFEELYDELIEVDCGDMICLSHRLLEFVQPYLFEFVSVEKLLEIPPDVMRFIIETIIDSLKKDIERKISAAVYKERQKLKRLQGEG